jgi:hypothetical protein
MMVWTGAPGDRQEVVGGAAPVGSELIRVGPAAVRPERVDPNGDRPELDLMDEAMPWWEERDIHAEQAETFESLILQLIPSEGGL